MARKNFSPSARGSLVEIADHPVKIKTVKPESPRPIELLQGIRVEGGAKLTALDVSCWEMILSWTYEIDPKMNGRSYRIPASALTRFLGDHVKRSEVIDSFNRLREIKLSFGDQKSRMYSGVSMLVAWKEAEKSEEFFAYQFAEPVRMLMRDMTAYAHIELGAICSMSGKYHLALYKALALEASKRKWVPGDDDVNKFLVTYTPDQIANIVDYPRDESGRYNIGKLSALVRDHHLEYGAVRRFKAKAQDPCYEAGRGRRVLRYTFELTIQPPSPHHISARYYAGEVRTGGKDDSRFQVRSDLWIRAARAFRDAEAFQGYLHLTFFELWLVALSEAINGDPLTSGYSTRSWRGESLLRSIEEDGAETAAWSFLIEELKSADLSDHLRDNGVIGSRYLKSLAEYDRYDRIGWRSDKKRQRAKRYYDLQKPAQSVAQDWYYEASAITDTLDTVDDFSFASYFSESTSDFDKCTKISVSIRDMPISQLETEVIPLVKPGSGEGRKLSVVMDYEDPYTRNTQFFERTVTLTFDEWARILVDLQPHMVGPEAYLDE